MTSSSRWQQHFSLSSEDARKECTMWPHSDESQASQVLIIWAMSYRLVFSQGRVLSLRGCLEMSGYNFGCLDPKTVKKDRGGRGHGRINVQGEEAMTLGNLSQLSSSQPTIIQAPS